MSEEQKRVEGSDDDRHQNLESGIENSDHSLNDSVDSTTDLGLSSEEQELRRYVAGGKEVQTSDVLIIEELPEEMCHEQNSDEGLESSVSFEEYPSNGDEGYCGHLPQAYFDIRENVHSQEKIKVLNIKDILSVSQIHGNEKDKPAKVLCKKNQDEALSENDERKAGENSKTILNDDNMKKVAELKESKASEMRYDTCEVIKSSSMPMYKFTDIGSKNKRLNVITDNSENNLKCLDYNSDEFADIEDNLKDSSSSDNNEPTSGDIKPKNLQLKEVFVAVKSNQERKANTYDGTKDLKKVGIKSSSNFKTDPVKNKAPREKLQEPSYDFSEPSCSYISQNKSKRIKTSSAVKIPEDEERKMAVITGEMATISELPDLKEDNQKSKTDAPPVSKTNPLKMKSMLFRKDKCNVCNVRLGLCAINCRCGGYFCAKHRYDKEHNCTFDYKSMGAEEIRKNNPRVVAEKVRKL